MHQGGEQGYILLDVLVALLVVTIGFGVFLGGMSLAGALSVRQKARVECLIGQRNADAAEQKILFQKE
ncbi:MAG: hypothetical protein ABSG63_19180 [Spirochaetia bacterium]|jgi:hypothetical protein